MASASVEEELQCPICMEFLANPVTLDCGHNYCRGCITDYCEKWEDLGDLECPLCKARIKRGNFRPNFSLANIVEKIKLLTLKVGKEDICVRHKEKLLLFCKEDKELVCLFCERSSEHQSHTVLLLEEAAEEYKAKFQDQLKILVNEQERILRLKIVAREESRDLLKQVKTVKKRAMTEFRQLQQYLQEQENLLLAEMEEVEDQLATRRDEHLARLSEEFSSLENLIQEIQGRLQQPTGELLKNVGSTLQKYETRSILENLVVFPDQLKHKSREFSSRNHFIENEIKRLKAAIALQPDYAHSNLMLPEGHKNVRHPQKYARFKDTHKRNPFHAEVLQPSREQQDLPGSIKKRSKLIRIYRSDSYYGDLS